VNGGRHLK